MIETVSWTPASGVPRPMYRCTDCGADVDSVRVKKDDPNWHHYDCSIQRETREEKALIDRFLRMNDDFPLLHFTVIDPKEMGYSDDPAEVQKLIDAVVETIKAELEKERQPHAPL